MRWYSWERRTEVKIREAREMPRTVPVERNAKRAEVITALMLG